MQRPELNHIPRGELEFVAEDEDHYYDGSAHSTECKHGRRFNGHGVSLLAIN